MPREENAYPHPKRSPSFGQALERLLRGNAAPVRARDTVQNAGLHPRECVLVRRTAIEDVTRGPWAHPSQRHELSERFVFTEGPHAAGVESPLARRTRHPSQPHDLLLGQTRKALDCLEDGRRGEDVVRAPLERHRAAERLRHRHPEPGRHFHGEPRSDDGPGRSVVRRGLGGGEEAGMLGL
jgi:hypothetical protein